MARRTRNVTIEEEGRDKGKVFVLTEMPATAAEKWATQAIYLMTQAGAQFTAEAQATGGMAALAEALTGQNADGKSEVLVATVSQLRALQDPSLESWWDCVQYQHAPNLPAVPIERGERCQIEEIKTVAFLRMQVFELHLDFFSAESPSTSGSPSPGPVPTGSRPTRISHPRSVR